MEAVPADRTSGPPRLDPSTLNCTDPLGVPEPGAIAPTVAVNVTDWPNTDGLTEEVTEALLPALFTTWAEAMVPVLPLKLASPEKTADTVCEPTASVVVDFVAWPPDTGTDAPMPAPSTLNCTVPPCGLPDPGAMGRMTAVNVTCWPNTDGLADVESRTLELALLTVCPPGRAPVLPLKAGSPEYVADTVCVPTGSESVETAAWPPFRTIRSPRFAPSTMNWKVPVGVPASGSAETAVAMNIT